MNNIGFTAENIIGSDSETGIPSAVMTDSKGDNMDMKSIAKGATVGAIAGLTCYAMTTASPVKKYSIKKDADKTLKSAGRLLSDLKSVLM